MTWTELLKDRPATRVEPSETLIRTGEGAEVLIVGAIDDYMPGSAHA